MIITSKVNMDLQQNTWPTTINAVQGDQFTRNVEISLYSNGEVWTIPEGVTMAVRYRKPDKTKGYYDTMPDGTSAWSVEGNVITVSLAPQMLTASGTVLAQVEMLKGNIVLSTFSIKIYVEPNPAAGVLQSEDYVNWLQWMEDELEVRMNKMLETGDFTGPPGPAGAPAAIQSQAIEYQASADYKAMPTGEWSSVIPDVAPGEYLWTRTTVTYNSGSSVISYSVSRFGKDGLGSVASVAGVSPDADGNVDLTAENVKALPIGGGTMEGAINMNGQKLSGLNAPTGATEPATKDYADTIEKNAKEYADTKTTSAMLLASGWTPNETSGYIQTITVSGLTDEKKAKAYPAWPSTLADKLALSEETVKVKACSRSGNTMSFECWEEVPTLDIPIIVEVYV